MNPYIIGAIVVIVALVLGLAFYSMTKQSFAGAVGAKGDAARSASDAVSAAVAGDGSRATG